MVEALKEELGTVQFPVLSGIASTVNQVILIGVKTSSIMFTFPVFQKPKFIYLRGIPYMLN